VTKSIYVLFAACLLVSGCSKTSEQKPTGKASGEIHTIIMSGPTPEATARNAAREKAKTQALAEPYANDYGPESLPQATLASYPLGAREGYRLLQSRCTACHTASRPLNSQFVETAGKTKGERAASLAALKKSSPDFFADKRIWQVESDIWSRYVKRMMNKPGCTVTKQNGKFIWTFLSHDSRARKLGKNKATWKAHRQKLLARIKNEHPERYKALYSKH